MRLFSISNVVTSVVVTAVVFSTQAGHAQDADTTVPTSAPVVGAVTPETEIATLVMNAVQAGQNVQVGSVAIDSALIRNLYVLRAYKPLFVSATGTLPTVPTLRMLLNDTATEHGLKAAHYWSDEIESRLGATDTKSLAELDVLLVQSYIRFASDVQNGRTNPQDPKQNLADIELKKRAFTQFDALNQVAADNTMLTQVVSKLAPQHATYQRLVQVMKRLQAVKRKGGWPAIRLASALKPGDSDASIPLIRQRLVDIGMITDEAEARNTSTNYDRALTQGIIYLQSSLKLGIDGVIGSNTLKALAVPVDTRIDQIRTNLERWRLLPRDLGKDYLFVDLSSQMLDIFRDGKHLAAMFVVVGQELRQTPSFIDQVTDVIVNPYWNAPTSIVVKDILPKAVRDPGYFRKLRMRVFSKSGEIDPSTVDWSQYSQTNPPPFRFREEPGDQNSLGRLKFDLSENHHAIYLHDTNHRELFDPSRADKLRLFSSGCIRLENPLVLADFLLTPQGITGDDINEMIDDSRNVAKRIKLAKPYRVYIMGTTMSVDRNNVVRFGLDIYGQDKRVLEALN